MPKLSMIEETGQVIALQGDTVWVRAATRSDCRRCAEGRGCGGGIIAMLLADRLATVTATKHGVEVCIGDRVQLGIPAHTLVRAAAVMYLLPLVVMLASLLLVSRLWPGSQLLAPLAGSLAGLVLGLLLARRLAGHASTAAWRPVVIRRITSGQAGRPCA